MTPIFRAFAFLSALALVEPAVAAPAAPAPAEATAAALRDKAMAGDHVAWEFVEEMTTRFGPRLAGSAAERAAAGWAAERFRKLGFRNVQLQTFPLTGWARGAESASITAPFAQPLAVAALGHAPPTPAAGIEAEVAVFATLEDLTAAPEGSLRGKVAMVNRPMVRMQDGSGYGPISRIRSAGPGEAAKKGAVAFLLRSAGTDDHRMPHTGTTRYEDGRPTIPAFALSIPDADQVARLAELGPVRVRLSSGASTYATTSQNVIGEVRGRERPEEVVLLGCHLDSWDLGTGAIDDAAGCAIVTAAAELIDEAPRKPRRTVRVVLFGAEEVAQPNAPFGAFGGHAYANARAGEVASHVIAGESDFGADRIYALSLPKGAAGGAFAESAARVLLPLGILPSPEASAGGGVDIGPTVQAGSPSFTLRQDGTRYFDLHHTANDTLDKIDREQLNQNVAAWAALVWLIAESDVDFRAPAAAPPTPAGR